MSIVTIILGTLVALEFFLYFLLRNNGDNIFQYRKSF